MNVTSSGLTRAAGAAAATAGAIFIAVQVDHPAGSAFDTQTTEWVARSCAKAVMAVLALVGITGIWLRQHRQTGLLGLIGYAVFAIGYLTMLTVQVIAATILPTLLDTNAAYVMDVVHAAEGGTPAGDIGAMQVVLNVSGAGYILGGLLFGIALFRAGVLARWASVLLAVSTTATAALAVLPDSFNRPLAVPEAVALIGLGVSLWRNPSDPSHSRGSELAGAVLEPADR
ncbi:hypothetical protein [Nocardioides sediminis]|uniref:hypothetical protein n=1 Tax=Nocardioides sediminis TaxID=433648 RepID=UPI000D30E556|nr:hypothetical protein [Nocardioides sediminis]